jgi:hypothetical protein
MGKEIKDIGRLQKNTKKKSNSASVVALYFMVYITVSTGATIFHCLSFLKKLISIFHRETTHKTPPGFKKTKKETDLKEDFGLPPKEIKMTQVYWVISIFVQSITLPCLMKKRCEDGACLFKNQNSFSFLTSILQVPSQKRLPTHGDY